MLEGAFGIDAAETENHGIYENNVNVTEQQLNRLNPPETLDLSNKYYVQFAVNLNSFIEYQDEANFDANQTTLDDAFGLKEIFVGYSGSNKPVSGDLIPSDSIHMTSPGGVEKEDLWHLYRGAVSGASTTTIVEQNIGGLNFTVNVQDSSDTEVTVTEVAANGSSTLTGGSDTNFTSDFNLILQYGVTTGASDTEAGVLTLQNLNMANSSYTVGTVGNSPTDLDNVAFTSLDFTQAENTRKQQNLVVQINRASDGLSRDNLASYIDAAANDSSTYANGPSSKAGDEGGTIVDGLEDTEVIPFSGIAASGTGALGDSNAGLETLETLPAGLNMIGPLLASDGQNGFSNDVQTAGDSVPGDTNVSVSHRQQDDFPAASDTMSFSKTDFFRNNALTDPIEGTNYGIGAAGNILSASTAKNSVYSVIDDFAFKVNAIDPDTLVTLDSSGNQIQDSNVPGVHNQISRFARLTTRKANVDGSWDAGNGDAELDLDDAFSAAADAKTSANLSQKVRHFDEDEKVVIVGDLNLDAVNQANAFVTASTTNVKVTVPDLTQDSNAGSSSSAGSIELFNQNVYLVLVQKGLHTDKRWEFDSLVGGGSRKQGATGEGNAVATAYSYESAAHLCAGVAVTA
jgi:hypothetical protein